MTRVGQGVVVFAVALAALVAGALYRYSQPVTDPLAVDAAQQLLALSLPDLAGKSRTLAEWRGKILVVNFWATWCPPCREEIPGFIRLSEKYRDGGVQFVGISIDSADKVRDFAAEYGVNYQILLGDTDTMRLASGFGNRSQGLPFTVVLDRSGGTRQVRLGRLDEDELDAILAKLK